MKRALSLSFLFLTGVIILAHAVIPHHHHDGVPDVTIHHERDGNIPDYGTYECWLLTVVKARMSNDKQICQTHGYNFNLLTYLFSDNSIPQVKDDIGQPFSQKPYLQSFHTAYISQSLGLRAPPVC
jgi:hypothetical protein